MKRLTEDQVIERLAAATFSTATIDRVMRWPAYYFGTLRHVRVRWVEDHYEEVEG